jgi:hypothetical protein
LPVFDERILRATGSMRRTLQCPASAGDYLQEFGRAGGRTPGCGAGALLLSEAVPQCQAATAGRLTAEVPLTALMVSSVI